MSKLKRLFFVFSLVASVALFAAQPKAQSGKRSTAIQKTQAKKLTANDADVDFALRSAESALRQYSALPEAKKKKLEVQVARAAGVKDVKSVSATMRTIAASVKSKSIVTKESRADTRTFLNANPKWCAAVKAARISQQAMQKMGMKGEMSLEDMLRLLPE